MNTTAEIYDLMETTGKSAPDITQALKNIGGDMQTGVKKIATYFLDEGRYSDAVYTSPFDCTAV